MMLLIDVMLCFAVVLIVNHCRILLLLLPIGIVIISRLVMMYMLCLPVSSLLLINAN